MNSTNSISIVKLPSHPAGNWYSFGDTVSKFDSVIQSVYQFEGERRYCINNELLGERKMSPTNVL